MSNIDLNALAQSLDSSWGRSSTPKTAGYSVKFTMHGDRITALYAAIVNFGTEKEMIVMKRLYSDESIAIINEVLKSVKATYKDITGSSLKTSEVSTTDSLEVIEFGVHNPKRTAYYRRRTTFEIG